MTPNCLHCGEEMIKAGDHFICPECDLLGASDETGMTWDNPLIMGDEEVYIVWEGECNMCGRERNINSSGYCSQCW